MEEMRNVQVPLAKRLSRMRARMPRHLQHATRDVMQPAMHFRMCLPTGVGGAPKEITDVHQGLQMSSEMSSQLKFPGMRAELSPKVWPQSTEGVCRYLQHWSLRVS